MAAVDLRASKTGYLTLDQAAAINTHGGYVDSCYHATARECGLTADECVLLARNSLEATFATPEEKAALVAKLRAYCEAFSA